MTDLQIHERFISLLETNLGIILKISKAYTLTIQDREDLINDIVYEMWKSYPNFQGKSKVSTWLYRIVLKTAMNYKRNTSSIKPSSSYNSTVINMKRCFWRIPG